MKHLNPGDIAPNFTGKNQDNIDISLSSFKGKKTIIYFYPKDMTPGCTMQSCNLRDNYKELLEAGFDIIGISADSIERHKKFEKKYDLPFNLIADTDHTILNKYGVWGEKKFMGRTYDGIHRMTFLINESGIIEHIIEKVKTKYHTEQILNLYK